MYPRLAKRVRRTYIEVFRENEEAVERLRIELSDSGRLPAGRLRQISVETGISERTLEGWRARWRQQPDWTPNYSHKCVSLKVSAEEEQQVAEILKREYIDAHRLCTKNTVRHIMKREIHRDDDEEINFGDKYISNFFERQQLSVRSPQATKCTK